MGRRTRRLSRQAVTLLAVMLAEPAKEWWGSGLCGELKLPSGTIYPLLARLEDDGLLTSRNEVIDFAAAKRPRRRYYRLTGEGETVARAEIAELQRALNPARPAWGLS